MIDHGNDNLPSPVTPIAQVGLDASQSTAPAENEQPHYVDRQIQKVSPILEMIKKQQETGRVAHMDRRIENTPVTSHVSKTHKSISVIAPATQVPVHSELTYDKACIVPRSKLALAVTFCEDETAHATRRTYVFEVAAVVFVSNGTNDVVRMSRRSAANTA